MAMRGRNTVVELYGAGNSKILQGEDVVSFEWKYNQEVKQDNYLGVQHETLEEVYKSVSFTLVLNHRSRAVADFIDFLAARGRQETEAECKIISDYDLPNGDTYTQTFPHPKFSDPGMNSGSRDDNVESTFTGFDTIPKPRAAA